MTFLHSGQFFAAAQKKYVYVYDNRGTEIHCLKDHTEVSRLDFLPLHFLLTSVGDQGVLRYQDTSYGKIVAQHRTKLGSCDAMTHNPMNGVSVLGHGNGTVTLWSPNMGQPLVKMLCHRGPIRSCAVDPQNGHYLATAGADAQVKIFDLRTYKEVHSYFSAAPAVALDISQRGMLAVTYGNRVQIWNSSAIRGPKGVVSVSEPRDAERLDRRRRAFLSVRRRARRGTRVGVFQRDRSGRGRAQLRQHGGEPVRDEKPAAGTRGGAAHGQAGPGDDPVGRRRFVGKVRAAPKEVQRERREAAASAALGKKAKEREKNAEKSRMKGKNRVSKRYRKKQQNVVDDKKLRANLLKEERARRAKRAADPGAGDGPEGGGAMPGRTAGAASDAPVAPEGTSSALRRFYK